MPSALKGHGATVARHGGVVNPDLEGYLKTFGSRLPPGDVGKKVDLVENKIDAGHAIRQLLLDRSEIGDAFRRASGFEEALNTIDSLVEVPNKERLAEELPQRWSQLLKVTFSILAAALGNYRGNRMYFRERLACGGWVLLYEKLVSLRNAMLDSAQGRLCLLEEEIYGCLFTCAIDDETALELFKPDESETRAEDVMFETVEINPHNKHLHEDMPNRAVTETSLRKRLGNAASLRNPEALCVAFELYRTWRDTQANQDSMRDVLVVQAILHLAGLSTHNLVALHGTGLLNDLLSSIANGQSKRGHASAIYELTTLLLSLGITKLDDAHLLYRNARTSSTVATLLLQALRASNSPSYFHFDLSVCGHSSIELPELGTQFPPSGSSSGYTLSLWLRISKFDDHAHTTIFGAFDATQTCFVLVYLEKDSRNLILQTSVTSSRPSVRFKSMSFREGRWYHIVIAHQRPRTTSSSRVSLFVNGTFMEQLKANYPLPTPTSKAKDEHSDHNQTKPSSSPVQAFVGTPQDLASRLGKNVVSTQWRLGSAKLFSDVLSDDLVAVHYELGPRYFGNYQDCLGSFNTYQAAASLKIRNDSLYPGKEQRSDIIRAMEIGGSELLPERRVILGLSPANVFEASSINTVNGELVKKYLSQPALKAVRHLNHRGHSTLVVNSAIPASNDALKHSSGYAALIGDPAVVTVHSLDNAAWQVGGGTAVILSLLDSANDEAAVIQAINCIFESIRNNWRCSEALERENGFAVLSNLIAEKLLTPFQESDSKNTDDAINISDTERNDELALKVLTMILKFLGYRTDRPEHSVLNNPLAYRILLVDADLWRNMPLTVQKLYYEQFSAFGVHSKYHIFNAKRLSKMRASQSLPMFIVAKLTESSSPESFDHFLIAFKAMLSINLTGDCLRSCSMYITYALEKVRDEEQDLQRQVYSRSRSRSPNQSLDQPAANDPACNESMTNSELSTIQMASHVLKVYADLVCLPGDTANITKFSKTVTNKWLLNLLVSNDSQVVTQVTRLLARLLVVNGSSYVKRFSEEAGGMVILRHRLQRWCYVPAVWRTCLAILFGRDIAGVELGRPFNLFSLVDDLMGNGKSPDLYPQIIPVLMSMMQSALKALDLGISEVQASASDKPDIAPTNRSHGSEEQLVSKMSEPKLENRSTGAVQGQSDPALADILRTVIRFLADAHSRLPEFRDLVISSNYVQELLFNLYPVVVGSEVLDPDIEIQARESLVTAETQDILVRPLSRSSATSAYVPRTLSAETTPTHLKPRWPSLRRMSSYVLVKSENQDIRSSPVRLQPPPLSRSPKSSDQSAIDRSITEEVLEIVIAVYSDQILMRKDFMGLGLFMKVPPGVHEHQAFFESFILRNTITHVGNSIRLDQQLLQEPRVLANLQRLAGHLGEAVFEGWFIEGAETVLEFLGAILEYVQLPEVQRTKNIRLCSHIIATIREVLLRVVLLRLSELNETSPSSDVVAFMKRLIYWQAVLLEMDENQKHFLRLFCFLLYVKMTNGHQAVRDCAADIWRLLLVHKSEETSQIVRRAASGHDDKLIEGFSRLTEADNETFLAWAEENRNELDRMFFGSLSKAWTDFVAEENCNTEEAARIRIRKRKEKLKQWSSQISGRDEIVRRHETSCDHWRSNIYSSESIKKQRVLRDQQNSLAFNQSTWDKLKHALQRPSGLLEEADGPKWQLDLTEGRNRMRMRTMIDPHPQLQDYRPKRDKSNGSGQRRKSTLRARRRTVGKAASPKPPMPNNPPAVANRPTDQNSSGEAENHEAEDGEDGEDYEIVSDPRDNGDDYEDKNRKVLRSLHRDDQVEHVHNVSRIIGLEGSEGLLIIGKHHLYLLDGLFQRSDGEIVSVSHAPSDERDSYLEMISGRDPREQPAPGARVEQEVRSWRRHEVLSISKRRFLFRDVAIEMFFNDGRSYLLTTNNTTIRDDLYQKLFTQTSTATARPSSMAEDSSWRFDSVQDPSDHPQSLGSRFTSVFAQNSSSPATRKWMQGEMSNFNYLMHVNTMAGRTFNDLTQYPVFPWVLADYTSDELDLSDPRSFRDLTKPMGCQTPERQADFRERYQSFAEMGDHNAPPFHYGTHYSTAMIVTSYLIRLRPFVQSYLLLQGGSFDHPDRLFYSIEKTWHSASRGNMTDVREVIPEFFYLPEFLLNTNGFEFGQRQGDAATIDEVELPPWAKGDPKIFIARNREALESEYVSKNLHHWIDLIFGHKQQGEAALEATNVFHHLSYRGARDLDKIEDPLDRLATIGIIHNFGQTPHQVFQRSHPSRDDGKNLPKQIDTMAENLTRIPSAVFEINDRITSLQYSAKLDRLMYSAPSKINIGPMFDKYLEWGYIDGGIRFFTSDTKRLIGLFEHVHVSQISCIIFADSQTLVTAGEDCVISIWGVSYTSKSVDLQARGSLFGHRTAVTTLTASRSFRTLLSAAEDGQVLLWDLNRLEILRKLTNGASVTCARINDVNGTLMICRGPDLTLFTLNGDPIIDQNVCTEDDVITSCAFYEGSGTDWLMRQLIFTGHRRGVVNIWDVSIRGGAFVLEHIKRMHHLDQAGYNIKASITCVLPLAQRVYTGDEEGKV
ncbi:MAG: hypothetical protein Q9207_006001, partial [Kuettlingeria erythrocarpa]